MAKNLTLYNQEVVIIATALESRARDVAVTIASEPDDEGAADPGSDEHWELDVIAGLLWRITHTPELAETHGPIL